jgi:tripartite-type tricarboxylate transporter receptor subunit TctC
MIPFSPLFGTPQARYDATKFNWLGSSNPETAFLTVWHTAPVNTLADVQRRETTVAASGSAGAPAFFARMLNDVFKTKLKIVVGYPGSAEMFMAMENGEVEGFPSAFTTDFTALKPNWMKERKVKLLIQYGSHREEGFPTVPFAPDLISDPDDRAVMEAAFGLLDIGRPFLLPPGVPEDRVALMRKALKDVFEDPAIVSEADRLSIGIDHAQSGEAVQEIVNRVYQTPPRAIERVRRLLSE